MGQHAQAHALGIVSFAFSGGDKAMFNTFYLTQILIGQPMALTTFRKIDQYLLAACQCALLHDDALP
ncbi:hypothetical protein AR540_08550 [Pseudomonas sp. EpS/L25]|nr:hypothetical protein AR540_08550 [Pseudomonas sp. EpS/L25]